MQATILVIDDEENIRFTFDRLLGSAGYRVKVVSSLEEGIAEITGGDIDLVFADILLGSGETGIDVLREIKERDLTCPLILFTGYPHLDTAAEAVRLGAFDYLSKPVEKETLLRVAQLALKHKKMADENSKIRSNLEAIFRSVHDVILTVDENLVVVELNEAAQAFCGCSREIIGTKFDQLAKGCNGRCVDALAEAIEKRQSVEHYRIECEPADRPGRVVSLAATPLFDPQGVFSGAVMVVRDETCLVDLERDLKDRGRFHDIIGRSGKMQEIYTLIEQLANVQTSVLITGESGTGKELVAEAIHTAGARKDKPLVKVNCSALSESLLESELFGHVKGAFTGAVKDKVGRFQLADGGTIFLDEIGDISPGVQQRLLRVLQEKEFERVGDARPLKVDVRIIAATNKSLPGKIQSGEFREDLYYRLKVVEICLPPLRERKEDIPLLVAHFLEKFGVEHQKRIKSVSDDVLRLLTIHPWPGNVRQLAHTIEHAFVVCPQNVITQDHLPREFKESAPGWVPPACTDEETDECQTILQALEKTAGNKAMAARLLGIGRRTIYRKIKIYNIAQT